ncbi:AAA family ATPase [Undibacter mobilis]|uniref:Response regulator n=1 Tax=Undibacter mobilis TaxID=2292256 RepID=A0A371B909_9BRAD|nr:response regulator [Undibacter mobilis]RDV03903.1 response regulator [Undibacter mobilis]
MRHVSPPHESRTRVVIATPDADFGAMARSTFGASSAIDLVIETGPLSSLADTLNIEDATVVVVDLDIGRTDELAALSRLTARTGAWPPVVAVTESFDSNLARTLMQLRVADFLVKPVSGLDLVRTCARVGKKPSAAGPAKEAQIVTFLPAVGGAGVTMLAVQTALLLLDSAPARAKPSVCIVDLDFQHGAVADYLDLEPRLNLAEIEPRPDRLDRQLLEVMLSYHPSGLAVVAAPNRPAEMRSFDPDVVMRLLDLVSAHFDYVVFDMPRTWFSWTDSVLLGSNKLYVVTEATVPGLRHAKQLVGAITERLAEIPSPQVIVNRFQQKMFNSGLRLSDVARALGDTPLHTLPNDYGLVREAIDRGVPLNEVQPGNKIVGELKKIVIGAPKAEGGVKPLMKKLRLATG